MLQRWTLIVWIALGSITSVVSAQLASPALTTSLADARDFRVRVQAAFALGATRDPAVRAALEAGLRDPHLAVRAASAAALGRLGDRRAITALRAVERDPSDAVRAQAARAISDLQALSNTPGRIAPPIEIAPEEREVEWRRARYVVVLGEMGHGTDSARAPALVEALREELWRGLLAVRGIVVFRNRSQLTTADLREIRRRRLPTVQIDGRVSRMTSRQERRNVVVETEVSLTLQESGNLRGVLRRAAISTEGRRADEAQGARLESQSMVAAVRSVLTDVPDAIRRSLGTRVASRKTSDE